MRIHRSWIQPLCKSITTALREEGLVLTDLSDEKLSSMIENVIVSDLSVEDRLNDEVRQILGKLDTQKADYRKLFELTKQKLVKERNLIL